MTAPPAERAATRAKWAERLVRVDSHLTQAYVHREIWQALRDEIVRVNPTADGGFLASYTHIYAESVMSTITVGRSLVQRGSSFRSLKRHSKASG